MSRSEQRRAALRFCLTTLACVACLIGWVSILSFSAEDPPARSAWPTAWPPHNLCGPVGAWLAFHLFWYLGLGTYALAALVTVAVFTRSQGLRFSDPWLRFVGLLLICTTCSTAGALFVSASEQYLVTGPGGVLGAAAANFFQNTLQTTGTLILLACALIVGLLLAADELVIRLVRWLIWLGRRSTPALARGGATAVASARSAVATARANVTGRLAPVGPELASEPGDGSYGDDPPEAAERCPSRQQLTFEPDRAEDEDDALVAAEPAHDLPAAGESAAKDRAPMPSMPQVSEAPIVTEMGGESLRAMVPRRAAPRLPEAGEYVVPPRSLLDEVSPMDTESIEILCREKAYILEQTLNEFRLEVRVVAIDTGPVITVFELKLAPGIKVSQIASLTNDMARALKAPAVRVVAPLPGKNTIGIEVPNVDKEKVRIKDVMELAGQRMDALSIPLFLGKDASGQPLLSDLTRMPHLLIAGTTGSGKSVCIASVIMSILMTRTPAEVNLILVDPKVVELQLFKDVPHLMCPIVTEVSKAEAILDWAATKMDERYALFAEAGVKDIRTYNRLGPEKLRERFEPANDEEMATIPTRLPYIVIIIDELADLMMTSAKEVEFYLCRLAQKSRAVGIHLIVSTQRPQANVVTGLVKSNLPCRVAFRVSSRLDSRIVLDQNGGEVLMGQGDMLFLPPGSAKLVRAQGTFVSDEELRAAVRHCREQCQQQFHPELIRMPDKNASSAQERDELFDQAVEIIIATGRGSVSLLQRRLTVGYSRASRLIDQMYNAGIVGEYKGSQAREVLLTQDEWVAAKGQRDREEAAEASELTFD
ncbi:MAG: DNA translocase FtsK [Planctomycetes bacterium]|nr:DNA translocase FtsK [Planctomycetota bacterium]